MTRSYVNTNVLPLEEARKPLTKFGFIFERFHVNVARRVEVDQKAADLKRKIYMEKILDFNEDAQLRKILSFRSLFVINLVVYASAAITDYPKKPHSFPLLR